MHQVAIFIQKPRQIFILKNFNWKQSSTNNLLWTFPDSIYSNLNLFTTTHLINRKKYLIGIARWCCLPRGTGEVTQTSFKAPMWTGRKVNNSENQKDWTIPGQNQSCAGEPIRFKIAQDLESVSQARTHALGTSKANEQTCVQTN